MKKGLLILSFYGSDIVINSKDSIYCNLGAQSGFRRVAFFYEEAVLLQSTNIFFLQRRTFYSFNVTSMPSRFSSIYYKKDERIAFNFYCLGGIAYLECGKVKVDSLAACV